jgi:hypothetical protein
MSHNSNLSENHKPNPRALKIRVLTLLTITLSCLIEPNAIAEISEVKKMDRWFTVKNCEKLEILKYQSLADQKAAKAVTLNDPRFIEEFMGQIENIPTKGEEMISFSDRAEKIELQFYCGAQKNVIELYGGKFKTPSTGFNSDKNEHESRLYRDINALLEPGYNKIIPKVKNFDFKFEDFSLIYKGHETESSNMATVNFSTDTYIIKDCKSGEQTLKVTSGQLPPSSQEFKIKGFLFSSNFTLLTYETKTGDRLYPNYFQIND